MNVDRIKKNKERRIKLRNWYYKMVSPIANYLDDRDRRKYRRDKEKAEKITNEEIVDLVIKGIIKEISKTGSFNEEIIICRGFKDSEYRANGIYGFIESKNCWLNNKVLKIWYFNNYRNENIDDILRLRKLLLWKLKFIIPEIKIEEYIDKNHVKHSWRYDGYIKTIKISI